MRVGTLWYDDDKKTSFTEKVSRAVAYYRNKYGMAPELCYVRTIPEGTAEVIAGCAILTSNQVFPYRFWLGMRAD